MIIFLIMLMRRAAGSTRGSRGAFYDTPAPAPKPYEPPMHWRTRFFLTRESQRLLWSWLWEMYCGEFLIRFALFGLAMVVFIVIMMVIFAHLMPA